MYIFMTCLHQLICWCGCRSQCAHLFLQSRLCSEYHVTSDYWLISFLVFDLYGDIVCKMSQYQATVTLACCNSAPCVSPLLCVPPPPPPTSQASLVKQSLNKTHHSCHHCWMSKYLMLKVNMAVNVLMYEVKVCLFTLMYYTVYIVFTGWMLMVAHQGQKSKYIRNTLMGTSLDSDMNSKWQFWFFFVKIKDRKKWEIKIQKIWNQSL